MESPTAVHYKDTVKPLDGTLRSFQMTDRICGSPHHGAVDASQVVVACIMNPPQYWKQPKQPWPQRWSSAASSQCPIDAPSHKGAGTHAEFQSQCLRPPVKPYSELEYCLLAARGSRQFVA
ncbi:hypothetical protein CEXT_72831 [Caerostris extrusa]|uniref:Uncharacterized protein n=1 Tax=Caerostris extrusa TaxID=172846 RepID=A0AAV4R8M2_CAEEX|nr:hypothetical protein CEXT_72831 [Caerostris extrusa]